MALWKKFFGRPADRYSNLEEQLSAHERSSAEKLHNSHPHLRGLFDKHQIDLRQIRKNGVKVAAAAAVLGAFLAIPFLLGHPSSTVPKPASGHNLTNDSSTHVGNAPPIPTGEEEKSLVATTTNAVTNAAPSETPEKEPSNQPPEESPTHSKSRRHIFGRSYLAPPKGYGFHDLGLHKGSLKHHQTHRVGSHPAELDIHKKRSEP